METVKLGPTIDELIEELSSSDNASVPKLAADNVGSVSGQGREKPAGVIVRAASGLGAFTVGAVGLPSRLHHWLKDNHAYTTFLYSTAGFLAAGIGGEIVIDYVGRELPYNLERVIASVVGLPIASYVAQIIANKTAPRTKLSAGIYLLSIAFAGMSLEYEFNYNAPKLAHSLKYASKDAFQANLGELVYAVINVSNAFTGTAFVGAANLVMHKHRSIYNALAGWWKQAVEENRKKAEQQRIYEAAKVAAASQRAVAPSSFPKGLTAFYWAASGGFTLEEDGIRKPINIRLPIVWRDIKYGTASLSRDARTVAVELAYSVTELVPNAVGKREEQDMHKNAVFLFDTHGGGLVRVIDDAFSPVFSPYENKLAYLSFTRGETTGICVANQDGSNATQLKVELHSGKSTRLHDWRRGVLLARDSQSQAILISGETNQLQRLSLPAWVLSPNSGSYIQFGPDAREVYYCGFNDNLIEYGIWQKRAVDFFKAHKDISDGLGADGIKLPNYFRLTPGGRFLVYASGNAINGVDLTSGGTWTIPNAGAPFDIKSKLTN